MGFLDWFRKSNRTPNAESHYSYAVSLLDAGKEPEALHAFSRVLQFLPNHEQALAWRKKLVIDLGLVDLDRAARAMEDFAYSHCGPGYGWKVEMRNVYSFKPHQPHETYEAAL